MHVVTAGQMQELDRKTITERGIPGLQLMENAGRGTFEQIKRYFPEALGKNIVVLCGRGNNGGDGFVIGRYLLQEGARVKVFLFSSADKVSGDARTNLQAYEQTGGCIQEIADEAQWNHARGDMEYAGIIVDALLGTGLSSEVSGLYKHVIEDINAQSHARVVSVDIPSGIDATTGRVLGAAVQAHLTCTFGLPKRGLLVYPGASHAGSLEIIDIGIPQELIEKEGLQEFLVDEPLLRGAISGRNPDSHKGSYGHVLILAGSPGKTGAAAMTARAAMRAGAGLVTLGVPRTLNPILEVKLTEAMT
ncbi:MAG: NAD(P)H-hydrate epimerase, partial [Pseudomonadota bacterium]